MKEEEDVIDQRTDILIIGGGPGGMMTGVTALKSSHCRELTGATDGRLRDFFIRRSLSGPAQMI